MRKIILLILLLCSMGIAYGCSARTGTVMNSDHLAGNEVPSASPTPAEDAAQTTLPTSTEDVVLTMIPSPTEDAAQTTLPSPTENVVLTMIPTPTEAESTIMESQTELSFSKPGGFYAKDLYLELGIVNGAPGQITYTTDGREPAQGGVVYTSPILIPAGRKETPNVYSIRAKIWYEDGTSSQTFVHTYFVAEQIEKRYSTLVISLNGEPGELTEGPEGILYGENYLNRGRASERKVSIEAFTSDGSLMFSQFAGVRVYGGSSREYAVKSLKLFARKEYEAGKGSFRTSVFQTKTADGNKLIDRYDKLVLRAGGDDFQKGFLRDELAQRLAHLAGFSLYEASVPALCYLNGSYYGLLWLRESYCDKYFQQRNGKSDGEYVVLEGSDSWKSMSDDEKELEAAREYNSFYQYYANSDLTDETIYSELNAFMDVENYIRYMAFNLYIGNYDWPQGNFRCFRYYADKSEPYGTGERDGRWRFLLHDTDVGLATYTTSEEGAAQNNLKLVFDSESNQYSPMLTALMKREDSRQCFIDAIYEYMEGALSKENVSAMITTMCAERDAELAYYYQHLDSLKDEWIIYASPEYTEQHLQQIREFAEKRPEYMKSHLDYYFGTEHRQNR